MNLRASMCYAKDWSQDLVSSIFPHLPSTLRHLGMRGISWDASLRLFLQFWFLRFRFSFPDLFVFSSSRLLGSGLGQEIPGRGTHQACRSPILKPFSGKIMKNCSFMVSPQREWKSLKHIFYQQSLNIVWACPNNAPVQTDSEKRNTNDQFVKSVQPSRGKKIVFDVAWHTRYWNSQEKMIEKALKRICVCVCVWK